MSIDTSKLLGGIGALLMFIGILPYINYFGVIELVGLILVLIALYGLGSAYSEGGIFNNALYALIIAIVGGVVSAAVAVVAILSSLTDFLKSIFPTWNGTDWTALSGLTPDVSSIDFSKLWPLIGGIIAALVLLWIFAIISAFFVRRSLGKLATKSGIGLFSTAGLLMLIGALLIIAVGIGLILMWIAVLLMAIAFFRIKAQQTQPTVPAPAPA